MWICKVGTTKVPKSTNEVLDMIGYALRTNYTEEEAKEFWASMPGWDGKWEGDDIREAAINRIMWDIITSLGDWYDLMYDPEQDLWYNLVNYCECNLPDCLVFLKTLKLDPNDQGDECFRHSTSYLYDGWYHYSYSD